MKKLLILLCIPFLLGAAPSRDNTYTSGGLIKSADVTANEDAIFNYLALGVDTFADAVIVNADISGSANIQASKLNLLSITQDVVFNNDGNDTVVETNNDGTGHGQYIHADGTLAASKNALFVTTGIAQTTAALVLFSSTLATSDATVFGVNNHSGGTGILAQQLAEELDSGEHLAHFTSSALHEQSDSALVKIEQSNDSSSEPAFEINNDGKGAAIEIDSPIGPAIRFTPATVLISPTNGDLWFDGTNLKVRIGTTTFNLDKTAE